MGLARSGDTITTFSIHRSCARATASALCAQQQCDVASSCSIFSGNAGYCYDINPACAGTGEQKRGARARPGLAYLAGLARELLTLDASRQEDRVAVAGINANGQANGPARRRVARRDDPPTG
jgi:hypothetical protein